MKLHYQYQSFPNLISYTTLSGSRRGYVPEAIENYYEKVMSDLRTFGRNITIIKEVFTDDWTTRPNPLSSSKGAKKFQWLILLEFRELARMMPDLQYEIIHTFVTGKMVAVVSKIGATIGDVPRGFSDFPMFPGTDPKKLKGKSFNSMAIDIHILDNKEKISRTWHLEDWTLALDDMLKTGRINVARFDWPFDDISATLKKVPQCIYDFYDKILSDPNGGGQNNTLLRATIHEDIVVRPGFSTFELTGISGLRLITRFFGDVMPNIKYERKKMLLHEDMVVVLSKVSATVTGVPQGGRKEFLPFPGINPQDLSGKKFETLSISVHNIVDGKIKQTYHIDAWQLAVDQMLTEGLWLDFGFDEL